jgi:hypothetical protein
MRYVNRFYNIITITAEAVREDRAHPPFLVQCLITYIIAKGILQTIKIKKNSLPEILRKALRKGFITEKGGFSLSGCEPN